MLKDLALLIMFFIILLTGLILICCKTFICNKHLYIYIYIYIYIYTARIFSSVVDRWRNRLNLYCLIFQTYPLGFKASWFWVSQTAGQVSLLVDDGRKEARTVTDERTAWACRKVWMSSTPTKVRPLEPAGQVSVRWVTGETHSHVERTGQLVIGRRLMRVNKTERGISSDLWSPLAYVVRRQRAWRGRTGLPESGWTTCRSKYADQYGRELWSRQVGWVYRRERKRVFSL